MMSTTAFCDLQDSRAAVPTFGAEAGAWTDPCRQIWGFLGRCLTTKLHSRRCCRLHPLANSREEIAAFRLVPKERERLQNIRQSWFLPCFQGSSTN